MNLLACYPRAARNRKARQLDAGLKELGDFIRPPHRPTGYRDVYQVRAKRRDQLVAYLIEREIEVKIHYPIPLHLQRGSHKFTV